LDPMQPTGVWARGIIDGIQVGFSKPKFDDWAYTEVHMSTEPTFIPSAQTLVDQGKQATFDIVGLVPAIRHYFCVTHVDMSGRRSQPSKVVSAIPGVINNIPVQWEHENGLVSRLNMTGLFLTDPQNPDSVYAARMVMGTASDGQTITLDWTFQPKIIVAPFSILTYIADEANNNQRIEAWVENVSPKGFTAHCRLMIPGAETKHTVNYRMNNPVAEWTSGNSAPGVQDLRLELRLYKEASGLYSLSTTRITQEYRIEYLRLDGGPGTWELFGEFTDTRSLHNPNWLIRQTITDLQTKQHTLLLPPGQYQIRVTYTNFSWSGGNAFGRSGYIQVNTWGYRTDQIAQQGDLIYFAIEGGAVSESEE
ncbi:MAG TPA: hypothetical protein PKH75_13845, partial [Bacillota bacterium]|nr:hypothetical protein [Bacillota bacterium]